MRTYRPALKSKSDYDFMLPAQLAYLRSRKTSHSAGVHNGAEVSW
jgi:hypothetical protein